MGAGVEEGVAGDFAGVVGAEGPDFADDEVAIDVGAGVVGEGFALVDVPPVMLSPVA